MIIDFFSATAKNREFIGDVISRLITINWSDWVIGSGSSENGIATQKRFPEIIWQTSDPQLIHRKSTSYWINYAELNIKMPQLLDIDVEIEPWEISAKLFVSLRGIISIKWFR